MRASLIKATADLTWYFEYGVGAFERSTSGPMLERADMFRVRRQRDPELAVARRERAGRMRATGEYEPPVDELTAVPMHEHVSATREEPDTRTLERYGEVSRRLGRVALAYPLHARALAAAFGEQGAKWARHERGRCVALFPLVTSGQVLVARAKRFSKGGMELNDASRLLVEVEIDRIQNGRDVARRGLITRAMVEATQLLGEALSRWGSTL